MARRRSGKEREIPPLFFSEPKDGPAVVPDDYVNTRNVIKSGKKTRVTIENSKSKSTQPRSDSFRQWIQSHDLDQPSQDTRSQRYPESLHSLYPASALDGRASASKSHLRRWARSEPDELTSNLLGPDVLESAGRFPIASLREGARQPIEAVRHRATGIPYNDTAYEAYPRHRRRQSASDQVIANWNFALDEFERRTYDLAQQQARHDVDLEIPTPGRVSHRVPVDDEWYGNEVLGIPTKSRRKRTKGSRFTLPPDEVRAEDPARGKKPHEKVKRGSDVSSKSSSSEKPEPPDEDGGAGSGRESGSTDTSDSDGSSLGTTTKSGTSEQVVEISEGSSDSSSKSSIRSARRGVRWNLPGEEIDVNEFDDPLASLDVSRLIGQRSISDNNILSTIGDEHMHEKQKLTLRGLTQFDIGRSLWTGDHLRDWDLGVELTTLAESTPDCLHTRIQWYHLERDLMVFDEFMTMVQKCPHLTDKIKQQVIDMLRTVKYDKQKQRQFGYDMDAAVQSEFDYEDGFADKQQPTSSATFLNLPYLSLEKYAGADLQSLSSASAVHPARGIIQASTRTVNDKRELAQVVTTRADVPNGTCLHTSNFWCLIVNDNLILTCSRLNVEQLRSTVVNIIQPPYDVTSQDIRITSGAAFGWQFPSKDVSSWPNVLGLFGDSLMDVVNGQKFRHNGQTLDAETWSDLISKGVSHHIEVLPSLSPDTALGTYLKVHDLIVGNDAKRVLPTNRASREDHPLDSTKQTSPHAPTKNLPHTPKLDPRPSPAQAHTHLSVFQHSRTSKASSVADWAEILHSAMMSQNTTYSECPTARIGDIREWIEAADPAGSTKSAGMVKGADNDRVRKRKAAVTVIYVAGFFWPYDLEHEVLGKLFGALVRILKDKIGSGSAFLVELEEHVLPLLFTMTTIFAGNEHHLQQLPDHFVRAWLRFVTAILLAAEAPEPVRTGKAQRLPELKLAIRQLKLMRLDLLNGEQALTLVTRRHDLSKFEICSTRGIATLLVDRLCKGVMRGVPDVGQIYEDYYHQMLDAVTGDPFQRSHRDVLRDYQQELEAVLRILNGQCEVLDLLDRSNDQAEVSNSTAPDLPPFREFPSLKRKMRRCLGEVAFRIDTFEALHGRSDDLGTWLLSRIEMNRDKQESAVIVFTMVTIIFLPLSFVASVLGMNTSDVRNMDGTQWVFWVVAIPLTIVIMFASLWFAGLLDGLRRWLASLLRVHPARITKSRTSDFAETMSEKTSRGATSDPERLRYGSSSGLERRAKTYPSSLQRRTSTGLTRG